MFKRTASVVIGSAFGDEGKGLMTDYLAANADKAVVVRFNGGAQAGHTVQTPDGRRHVFHQFGSGALAGASTYLSRFFVANPILFLREREELLSLKANAEVRISGEVLISTPWDMFANTEIESSRGAKRHGSCGMGIGETVGRNENTQFKLQMKDLYAPDLARRLIRIRDEWLPQRFSQLSVIPDANDYITLRSDELFERFLEDLAEFCDLVKIREAHEALKDGYVIFEGAQGLLLDQNAGAPWFPNVTRSNTGLRNVLELAKESRLEALDVNYMLRAYLTRHGAGPLPFECKEKPYEAIEDATNIPNPWQGALRYAPLNLDLLREAVINDLDITSRKSGIAVHINVAVTCLDQVPEKLLTVQGGRVHTVGQDHAVELARKAVAAKGAWGSQGTTRETLFNF